MTNSKTFLLLQQEGFLIRSSLLSGLHHLRNARVDRKGDFYTGFFLLSIGLERLMKATFVIEFMRHNSLATPSNRELKDFGHELTTIWDHLARVEVADKPNPLLAIPKDSLERQILAFLSEFANRSRYHNLDSLGAERCSSDPLEGWDAVIQRILAEDVRHVDKDRVLARSAMLGKAMVQCTIVMGVDLLKKPMNVFGAIADPQYQELAARHAVYHVFVLVRSLVGLLSDLTDVVLYGPDADTSQPQPIPYMAEFFDFVNCERSAVLRKRRWL
jgi:hypothetical protein